MTAFAAASREPPHPRPTKAASPSKPPVSEHTGRILLIEEEAELRRLMSLALQLAGFQVHEARNGTDALAVLEHSSFDIAVLDVVLPDIDGISVRQEIAARHTATALPVVIITSFEGPLDHMDPACVVRKPILPHEIVDAVIKCLKASST